MQHLYVHETGPASAPTVVFLHGGGVSGWMWEPQVAALSSGYHCLVPDLPEQGRSRAIVPFTIADAASRVARLIQSRAHNGKAHVVGLSLGAQTLVELLSQRPDLVDHAIVSSALLHPIPGMRLFTLVAGMYMPFKDIDWLVRANMWGMRVPARYLPHFREDTRSLTASSFTNIMRANGSYRLPANLDRATAPALVVIGQKEYRIMARSARDLVQALPHASGYVARGLGHNWCFEAPDLFTRVAQAWIGDQPLPPGLAPLSPLSSP